MFKEIFSIEVFTYSGCRLINSGIKLKSLKAKSHHFNSNILGRKFEISLGYLETRFSNNLGYSVKLSHLVSIK